MVMVLESNGDGVRGTSLQHYLSGKYSGVVSVSSSAVSSVREARHLPPCHGDGE
jgi:hypothetical protein